MARVCLRFATLAGTNFACCLSVLKENTVHSTASTRVPHSRVRAGSCRATAEKRVSTQYVLQIVASAPLSLSSLDDKGIYKQAARCSCPPLPCLYRPCRSRLRTRTIAPLSLSSLPISPADKDDKDNGAANRGVRFVSIGKDDKGKGAADTCSALLVSLRARQQS